jgi:hypothetical protein
MGGELVQVAVAAGGLDQYGPGVHRRGHHDLRARAAGEAQGQPALVLPGELVHAREAAQQAEDLRRRDFGDQDQHQVAHHLVAAPHLSGDDGVAHPRHLGQGDPKAFGLVGGVVQQPVGGGLPQEGDALEDVLGGLLTESGQLGEPAVMRGGLQLG